MSRITTQFSALRPHQWSKNLLLFLPLIAAQQLGAGGRVFPYLITDLMLATIAFCAVASAGYLINDILDRDTDKAHPTKNARAIASGALSVKGATICVALLLASGALLASPFDPAFLALLVLYFLLSITYSLFFKEIAVLDVIILALLYTLRIFAGGVASQILVSPWLLTFSLFFFFSLACIKRLSELVTVAERTLRRGYAPGDAQVLTQFATASGYISVVVLLLYSADPQVLKMYQKPWVLWSIAPLLLFWISRMVLLASRGEIHGDPLSFALKERMTYLIGAIMCAAIFLAK